MGFEPTLPRGTSGRATITLRKGMSVLPTVLNERLQSYFDRSPLICSLERINNRINMKISEGTASAHDFAAKGLTLKGPSPSQDKPSDLMTFV